MSDPREVWDKWMPLRDSHPAALIQREVLATSRRALVVYGDAHLFRRGVLTPGGPLVARLESTGTKVFSIRTAASQFDRLDSIQADVSSWPVPAVAMIRGTLLGVAHLAAYGPPGSPAVPLEEFFDAVLYLGHPRTIALAPFPPGLCGDKTYIAMRTWRTGDANWASRFQRLCAQ